MKVRSEGGRQRYGQPEGATVVRGSRNNLVRNAPVDVTSALVAVEKALRTFDDWETKSGTGSQETTGAMGETGLSDTRDLTTTNFDGTECKSVEEFAAANRLFESAASLAILQKDGTSPELRKEARKFLSVKQLSPSGMDHDNTATIVFTFPSDQRMQVAMAGGEDYDDLHITLAYFGDITNTITLPSLQAVAMTLASEFSAFMVNLNGISRFSSDSVDPIVVNADAVVLPEIYSRMRELAHEYQVNYEPNHGYSPHMTIGYVPYGDPMPMQRWTPIEVSVDMIELWYGKGRYAFMLGEDYSDAIEHVEDYSAPYNQVDEPESKARHVRDSSFWKLPVGTPLDGSRKPSTTAKPSTGATKPKHVTSKLIDPDELQYVRGIADLFVGTMYNRIDDRADYIENIQAQLAGGDYPYDEETAEGQAHIAEVLGAIESLRKPVPEWPGPHMDQPSRLEEGSIIGPWQYAMFYRYVDEWREEARRVQREGWKASEWDEYPVDEEGYEAAPQVGPLVAAIAHQPATDKPIYRGMKVNDSYLSQAVEGARFSMGLSSFTTKDALARNFSTDPGMFGFAPEVESEAKHSLVIQIEPGARAVNLGDSAEEHVTMGQFEIIGRKTDDKGVTTIVVTQMNPLEAQ